MRLICEAIGLQWKSQYNRLRRNEVLTSTISVMNMVDADAKEREQVCLPLEYLNGWLFGISISRVKPKIRQRLEDYHHECYQVLNACWSGGLVSNPRLPQQSEIFVAQAHACAVEAADIVSRYVFQAMLNGQVDPYQGRWLLEMRYAGSKRELLPSMRLVSDDALVELSAEQEADCVQMDMAVANLPAELKQAVFAYYTWQGGMDVITEKLCVTRATIHRLVPCRLTYWGVA